MNGHDHRHRRGSAGTAAGGGGIAPGRRTLTQGIAARSLSAADGGAAIAGSGPLGDAEPQAPHEDPFALHLLESAPTPPPPAAVAAAATAGMGDVSGVLLHTDAHAQAAADAHDARALTVGPDIYFGGGQYQPGTADGDRLLGHELAHGSQQRGSGTAAIAAKLRTSEPGDATEIEADRAGDVFAAALAGAAVAPVILTSAPPAIARSKKGHRHAVAPEADDAPIGQRAPLDPLGQSRPLDPFGQSRPLDPLGHSFADPSRDADRDGRSDLFRPHATGHGAAATHPSRHAATLIAATQAATADVSLIASTLLPAYAEARDALDAAALQALASDVLTKYQAALDVRDEVRPIVDASDPGHASHDVLPATPERAADRGALLAPWGALEAALTVAESRLATDLGPTRFQGRELAGGVAPVRIARHARLTVPRLLREAIHTGELVAAVAEIRDMLPAAALATVGEASAATDPAAARAIADRLAPFASRPVHFAFIKAALGELGLWVQVEHATGSDGRSLAQVDAAATAQAARFGAGADLGTYNPDQILALLKAKNTAPNETTYTVTESNARKVIDAISAIEDPAGRAAALKDLDDQGLLPSIARMAAPAPLGRLHDSLPPGAGHVAAIMRPHFQGRDTGDNSLGTLIEGVPGVGGVLHASTNIATFGFLDEHDAAYRAMRAGEITVAEYDRLTGKALLRAGVVGAVSYATGGAAGAYAEGLTGSLAARGVVGRIAANTFTGAAAGSAGAVGARLGSDAVDGRLSSGSDYVHDAMLGGAIGGGLGGGLTTVGAAGAKFLPESVKTPLHRLAERFPSLADDAETFAAFQRLGKQHSQGVVSFAIGSRQLLQLAADGAITLTAEAWRSVRQFGADTRALGTAARAQAVKLADDLADGFGPQLAGAGAYGDVRLNVTAKAARRLDVPGPLDGPAVTVMKAERLADDLVSTPGDDVGSYLGDGPETTGMQVVDVADDAASQRGASAAASRSATAGSRTPLAEHIPAPGPAFVEWFDGLTLEELDTLLRDTSKGGRVGARKVIEDNVRHPGGLHEWVMVKHLRKVKEWGISLETVLDARTATEATVGRTFRHKRLDGRTGAGPGSGTMHRQLDRMLMESGSLNEFRRRINHWADAELYPVPGPNGEPPLGRYYLPAELQLPAEGTAR